MNGRTKSAVAAAVAAAALAVPAAASPSWAWGSSSSDDGQYAVGLGPDGKKLVTFRTERANKVKVLGSVRGLVGDTRLVGIDYRVQDRRLYGVGDAGGVYTIKGNRATKVSQLTTALSGTMFGVDFNPAANRLRVISDTGQNLRHNIDDGVTAGTTAVDGVLTYPPATRPALGVTAAAYTNNDLDLTTATTLFDLDVTLDQVAIQAPANAGTLSPTGTLGVEASVAGFDIVSETQAGVTVRNTGYAVLKVGDKTSLRRIDLLTGKAGKATKLPYPVADLAIAIDK